MQRSIHLLLFVIFSIQFSQGQNNIKELRLNLNEKLSLNEIGLHKTDQFNWELLDSSQQIITQNSGLSINEYIFGTPGHFFLKISNISNANHEACKHENSDQLLKIKVADYAIHFDIDHITFSPQLNASQLVNGIEMTIPIDVKMLSTSQTLLTTKDLDARFQGVGCNVTTKVLNPQIINQNGQFFVQFFVHGSAEPGSFIMIDFVDPSGKISTYYHTTEL